MQKHALTLLPILKKKIKKNGYLLYSANPFAEQKTQSASTYHSCTHTHRCAHDLCLQEWSHQVCTKAYLNTKVLSCVLNAGRLGRFCRLAGNKFQTDWVMKLKECWPKCFKLHSGIFKSRLAGNKFQTDWVMKLKERRNNVSKDVQKFSKASHFFFRSYVHVLTTEIKMTWLYGNTINTAWKQWTPFVTMAVSFSSWKSMQCTGGYTVSIKMLQHGV